LTPVMTSASGGEVSIELPPFPSCPAAFAPQHLTPPLAVTTAHVNRFPELMTVTSSMTAVTGTAGLFTVEPSPSAPSELRPQHRTSLNVDRTQTW
jgi:hypothetical protein